MIQKGRYQEFRKALNSRLMIFDGSMGALLMKRGLPPGHAPDLWNLENPKVIEGVQKEYAEAGADILITNTFGASRWRLDEYRAHSKLVDINARAVEIARRAGGERCFVAGDLGPCGDTVFPTGSRSFDEVFEIFREQARVLIDEGVDLIVVETMFDSMDFKAALAAVRDLSLKVPLIGLMTFNTDTFSDTGISPEACVAIAEGYHCDAVGANCSVGPQAMLKVVEKMKVWSRLPIAIQPNAGMPELRNGETVFPMDAVQMAEYIPQFFERGTRILGGCCGTTPEYIKAIRHYVDSQGDRVFGASQPLDDQRVLIASKTRAVGIGPQHPFVMIGEKINPTGRKKVADMIRQGNIEALLADAHLQIQNGAQCLDVNVGVPLIDEPKMMREVITTLQNSVEVPLVIDSSFSLALKMGGEVYYGRPLLNSINAEDEKLEEVIPIAKRTGGAMLALITETMVPEKAEDRLIYARKILDRLIEAGFNRHDVVFDVLALTVSAMREGARESLRTIELIQKELGCATTFGLSNSSFGLPNRRFVHQSYLMMAVQRGLNSAIMNVLENQIATRVAAAELFGPRGAAVENYLDKWSQPISEGTDSASSGVQPLQTKSEEGDDFVKQLDLDALETEIFWDIVDGKKDKIQTDIREFLKTRSDESFSLFLEIMTPGIRYLGDLFAKRKRFIPHLVASAEAMKLGVALLEPFFKTSGGSGEARGTIVFATVKGDIHDIGKNICILMLKNFGYQVIDLGRNVAMDEIFLAAEKNKAQIIALSALMTTTMVQMKQLVEENRRRGLDFRVMVGGAPVTSDFAREIGADGHCEDVGTLVGETERVFSALGYMTL
ncbi:MAG: homocysteine S-methyltransferase family protein [Bdellovibrionales bacterium]|nr:homocysteine S-methyltransferase family protein [Bdellovibrionales bacterium]